MSLKTIKINDIELRLEAGKPFTFDGLLSGSELAGIELDFIVVGDGKIEMIEQLFKSKTVTVHDPFANKSYNATIHLSSSSYQVGRAERSYRGLIKEVDTTPEFCKLEIDGQLFDVLKYEGKIVNDDKISHHVLLKLTEDQFKILNGLLLKESVQVRRINVDDEPLVLRFGGDPYWSRHDESGVSYFKQIVWLNPLELEPSKLNLASGNVQGAIARMLILLRVRFERLVEELSKTNIIDQEGKATLFSETLQDLASQERIDDLFTQLYRVQDAETEFL